MKLTTKTGLSLQEVAPGITAPVSAGIDAKDLLGYDVHVEVALESGRYVAREVAVRQREGGPPVTGEAIRRVPVAGLIRRGVESTVLWVTSREGGVVESTDVEMPEDIARHGPTDEALTWVARTYRLALLLDAPPTKSVEASMRLPRSTAGRWVALARERGFLGPSEGAGKAGG